MVFSFLIPRSILKRQQADYDEIQTIISMDTHAPAATTQRKETACFLARKSQRIKSRCPAADGETWMEIVVCNTPTGARSLFYSLTSKQAKWDEPPSGASKIIYKSDVDAIAVNTQVEKKKISTTKAIPSSKSIDKSMLPMIPEKLEQEREVTSNKWSEKLLAKSDVLYLASMHSKRMNDKGGAWIKSPAKKFPVLNSELTPKPSETQPFASTSIRVNSNRYSTENQGEDDEEQTSVESELSLNCIKNTVDSQLSSIEEQLFATANKERQPCTNHLSENNCTIITNRSIQVEIADETASHETKALKLDGDVISRNSSRQQKHQVKDANNDTNKEKKYCQKSDHSDGTISLQTMQGSTMQKRMDKMKLHLQAIEKSLLDACSSNSQVQRPVNDNVIAEISKNRASKEGKITLLDIARSSYNSASGPQEKVMAVDLPKNKEMTKIESSVPLQQKVDGNNDYRRQQLQESKERRLRQAGLIAAI